MDIFEDGVEAAAKAEILETADDEAVIGLDIGDYEVPEAGLEDGLGLSIGALVNTDPSTVVSNYTRKYAVVKDKPKMVPFLYATTPPPSACT